MGDPFNFIGGLRKCRAVGHQKRNFPSLRIMAANNWVRMRNLGVVSC